MKSEYLLFNMIVVLAPILSLLFVPNTRKPQLLPALLALAFTSAGFVLWDIAVTGIYWYFNPLYILGINVNSVPLEEVLFFITVPFGCLVLWVNWSSLPSIDKKYSFIPNVLCIVTAVLTIVSLYFQWYYSASVCLAFLLSICLDSLLETKLFQKSIFLIFLSSINILTFIFNLYLTARPIVTYNHLMKSNLNVITIPIEDFVYGMVLISFIIILYESFKRKKFFDWYTHIHDKK